MRSIPTPPLSAPGRLTAGLLALLLYANPLPAQTGLPTVALLNEAAQAGDPAGKKSLHEALQEINRVRGVFFMYDEQLLNGKYVNELSDFSGSLDRVLHRLLRNTGLGYKKIRNDTYVITPERNAGDTGQHPGRSSFEGVASLPSQLPPAPAALLRVNLSLPVGKTAEKRITGRVTSAADQSPLPGVSVLVKGTTVGTATDADGNYTLNAPDNAAVLVFSFIGYTPEEVPLNGRTAVDVALAPDVLALSEVVVVGYGERKKTTYTGSVAAIDNSEIVRAPVADLSNNLVGRLPGVIATQRTGEPGQDGSNITIRGISTTGSNAPLIVIDGIPRPDYGFSQIDPNEIENISILKDAAAAAVFGVRGANGVILQHGKLTEAKQTGLEKTGGLWAKILPGDFDGDGDTDYVLGNMGANLPWKASAREPLTLYADDFDGNGRLDPVLCAYVQGVSYPVASRDELLDQINPLRKKFVKYIHYADARPEDIFGAAALQKARKLEVHTLRTSYLENRGNGQFSIKPLPTEAQFSVASGLLAGDYNHDGHADVLLAGNFYPFRVQAGRLDAGMGLLLQGDGKGRFTPVPWAQSGFYAPGDVRDMLSLQSAPGREIILIGKNNDKVQAVAPAAGTHPLQ